MEEHFERSNSDKGVPQLLPGAVHPERNKLMNDKLSRPLQHPFFASAQKGDPVERSSRNFGSKFRSSELTDIYILHLYSPAILRRDK